MILILFLFSEEGKGEVALKNNTAKPDILVT